MYHFIVMAAGQGRRFGANKLLHEIHGKAMYRHILDKLERYCLEFPGTAEVVVVTAYDEIYAAAAAAGFIPIRNGEPERGLSHTIRLGVEAATVEDDEREGYVFFTADQPNLRYETICAFMQKVDSSAAPLMTVASIKRPGNPCYFSVAYEQELKDLRGEQGGRFVMVAHPETPTENYLVDDRDLDDLDQPEDQLLFGKENERRDS